jgi:hypothetical protein
MGHVRQKKSTSSSTSTPPEPLAIEFVNLKEHHPPSRENRYPEQLNAEELISQINCSRNLSNSSNNNNNNNIAVVAHHNNLHNEVRNGSNSRNNDSNNNSHANNNRSSSQQQQQQNNCQQRTESADVDDIEKGSDDEERAHRQKPLLRRIYSFIRNLWIGAKFNVGKAGELICN